MKELIYVSISFFLGWLVTYLLIKLTKQNKCCTKKDLIATGKCLLSNPQLYEYKCSKCGKIHNIIK